MAQPRIVRSLFFCKRKITLPYIQVTSRCRRTTCEQGRPKGIFPSLFCIFLTFNVNQLVRHGLRKRSQNLVKVGHQTQTDTIRRSVSCDISREQQPLGAGPDCGLLDASGLRGVKNRTLDGVCLAARGGRAQRPL